MKKGCIFPYLFLVILYCISSGLSAQTNRAISLLDMEAKEVPVIPITALLWEVDRADVVRPSYIFGILYKVAKEDFFLPEGIHAYIQQCDKLAMEVNPLVYSMDYQHRGTTPIDSTLDVLLPKKKYQRLNSYVKDSLSDLAYYQLQSRYAPILIARQMMADYCLDFRPGKEAVSYETMLAQTCDLPLKELGTAWTRTAWLDSYNFQEQTDILLETIDNRAQLCQTYRAMVDAYRNEDIDQLWLLAQDAPDLGDNTGKFIEARNQTWMKAFQWQMKFESLFVAVHAAQLPSEFGLIHLLRKEGFQVKPIFLSIPPK